MPGFFDFVRNQYTYLPVPEPPANIADATYIVTGANSGLGFECAKHLSRMGTKRLILAVRSVPKGEAALAAIRSEAGRPDVGEVWQLDMASLDSVEAFSKQVNELERLDGLIANAGVIPATFSLVDGMEESLVVNVVATMLLVFRLLPKLQASARQLDAPTHAVVVSSNAALGNELRGNLEKRKGDLFDSYSTKELFHMSEQYESTKLMEIYLVRQLTSLLPLAKSGAIINYVSPGLCYSDLDRNGGTFLRLGLAVMRKLFARTTEEGSRTLLQAAFAGPESHGKYCSECRVKDEVLPEWVTGESGQKTQKRLWDDLIKRLAATGHSAQIPGVDGK